jgi:methyl-accepting chemotaxis protein
MQAKALSLFKFDSLGKKLLVPTLILVTISLAALGSAMVFQQNRALNAMMESKAMSTVNFMEKISAGYIINYDLSALEGFVKETVKDPDVEFAEFYDNNKKSLTANVAKAPANLSTLIIYERIVTDPDKKPIGSLKIGYKRSVLDDNLRKGVLTVALSTLIVLAVVALGLTFIVRSVTHTARQILAAITQLADGTGDLSQRIKVKSQDELGQIVSAFNQVMEKIYTLVSQVKTSANTVTNAANQFSISSANVAEGSKRQSEAATATAAAGQEMTSSIAKVAETSEEVRRLSSQGQEQTAKANQQLAELVNEIGQVENAVQGIAAKVNEFVMSTHAITAMTKQVKDIADQTNLLALNAAIEAARAGEQGRGFAVVADEVRKLAEKSGQSASEIDAVTKTIDQQSTAVGNAIENGLKSLVTSQQFLTSVSSTLLQANTSVSNASKGVDSITISVKEQTASSIQITGHVERIAQMAEGNNQTVQETSAAAIQLKELAAELSGAVGRFKI